MLRPALSDHRKFTAGNDNPLAVDNAKGTVRILLELQNYILKNSPRHSRPPHSEFQKFFVQIVNVYIISGFLAECKTFFLFSPKKFYFFVEH
jgi:hypothetical protein